MYLHKIQNVLLISLFLVPYNHHLSGLPAEEPTDVVMYIGPRLEAAHTTAGTCGRGGWGLLKEILVYLEMHFGQTSRETEWPTHIILKTLQQTKSDLSFYCRFCNRLHVDHDVNTSNILPGSCRCMPYGLQTSQLLRSNSEGACGVAEAV